LGAWSDAHAHGGRGGFRQAPFAGTLFRLPLRTRAQSVLSELCNETYTLADVRRALYALDDHDTLSALSLRHVQHIEVSGVPPCAPASARALGLE
jgi:hypothetical protein